MATGKNRAEREARERARVYEARTRLHEAQIARRRRDNVVGVSIAAAVIALAIAGQALFYTVGPGVPEPTVAPTPTESSAPAPLLPSEDPSTTPVPTETSVPTETPEG